MTTDLDQLKSSSGSLQVYKSRVRLQKDGREWVGLCPVHSEKSGSFRVYLHENIWLAKCFGCGWTGNVIQFVEKHDNVSFKEAVEIVKKETGWTEKAQVEKVFKPVGQEKVYKTFSLEQYASMAAQVDKAKDFLAARGISLETARKLHLGFRQDVGKLAGKENEDIAAAGWVALPCVQGDVVVSIEYRSVVRKAFCRQPGMATTLFNTGTLDPFEPVLLTEGKFDAVVLEQAGFKAVSLPSSSYKVTPEDKDLLLTAYEVYLAGDTDSSGQEAMSRLWNEMPDRTYLLKWPAKDANETFVQLSGQNVDKFREKVKDLMAVAKSTPIPGIGDIKDSMLHSQRVDLSNDPRRWQWPWPSMDKMANIMPGAVVYLSSRKTGMGKTSIIMNGCVHNMLRGEVILNYSAELDSSEYAQILAAHLLKKDRNSLTEDDFKRAYSLVPSGRLYIGHDPDLNKADQVLDLIEAGIKRIGPGTVILDHIHFITLNEKDTIKAQENAMGRIKNMARKYQVKWINLGQPRKADQKFKGKPIDISDAKGSEMIISASDVAYAINRDDANVDDPNNPPREPFEPLTKVYLQKGRSQGTGAAYTELLFMGEVCTFSEISKDRLPFDQPCQNDNNPLQF